MQIPENFHHLNLFEFWCTPLDIRGGVHLLPSFNTRHYSFGLSYCSFWIIWTHRCVHLLACRSFQQTVSFHISSVSYTLCAVRSPSEILKRCTAHSNSLAEFLCIAHTHWYFRSSSSHARRTIIVEATEIITFRRRIWKLSFHSHDTIVFCI